MRKPVSRALPFAAVLSTLPGIAFADNTTSINDVVANLNTVWVMVGVCLVFIMQIGFALLESGMTRSKNTVNVLMKNYMDTCVGGLVFWLVGYGIMFGTNPTGWFGIDTFMPIAASDWDWSFILFQMMFAATATTIVSGAVAERMQYRAYLIGVVFITTLIYPIFGSWAWGSFVDGSGWLKELGFIDFAGSTVVHSIGGWCALAAIIVVGPRLGRFGPNGESRPIPGHNLTLVALGGFLLWFGWFGFNGGSTTEGTTSIGKIILNTHLAACAGGVSVALLSWLFGRPILLTSTVNGSLGGLVGITAGCATMDPQFAILTGAIAGAIVLIGPALLNSFGLDDVVDAVSVHAFCGVWGTLAAGIFFAGDMFDSNRIIVQAIGAGAAFLWGFFAAMLMYVLVKHIVGIRVSPLDEQRGLDFTEHAEMGYPEFQNNKMFDTDSLGPRS